ncbi:MAG: hypothetical protein AAFV74_07575, partial [Pseudomonadota bacterium]
AATAKSLIRKALARCSCRYFLRPKHAVFPQNRLKADLRRYGTPNSASNVFKADKPAVGDMAGNVGFGFEYPIPN